MWRGATVAKGFLDGCTMIVGGGFNNKLVLYPIAPAKGERQLINWVVTYRMGEGTNPPPRALGDALARRRVARCPSSAIARAARATSLATTAGICEKRRHPSCAQPQSV